MTAKVEVKKVLGKFQTRVPWVPGQVGDLAGNIEAGGGLIYVTVSGQVMTAYRGNAPAILGTWVKLGYNPHDPHILRVLEYYFPPDKQMPQGAMLGSHAEAHRWMAENGGTDPLWVELRQFMPFRVGAGGGLTIVVYRGVAWRNGQFVATEPTDVFDLTSYVPTDDSDARYLLVYLDEDGGVAFSAGTIVASKEDLTLADIPTPQIRWKPLAAIRLYAGMTEIVEQRRYTDILDVRFPEWVGGEPGGVFFGSDGYELDQDVNTFKWANADKKLFLGYPSIPIDSPTPSVLNALRLAIISQNSSDPGGLGFLRYGIQPFLSSYRANGTIASPSNLADADVMFRQSGSGYPVTDASASSRYQFNWLADGDWDGSSQGTALEVWLTKVGTTTLARVLRWVGDGLLKLFGTQAGVELPEVAAAATPSENRLSIQAMDDGNGNTVLVTKDADGNEQIKSSLAFALKVAAYRG